MQLWAAKRRIEKDYKNSLIKLLNYTLRIAQLPAAKKLLAMWTNSDEFSAYAEALAGKMITGVFDDVGRSWKGAAVANGKARIMYKALLSGVSRNRKATVQQMIQDNAKLIKTLPGALADDVTQYIMRETAAGRRSEDIAKDLQKIFPQRANAKAKLIARTEVAKTHSALIQSDCQELGVRWYFWRCVRDERSRDTHEKMEGVLCNWNDPPCPEELFPGYQKPYGRYPPGGTFNCRCYPEPLIAESQLENTIRVHRSGRLSRLTKEVVRKMTGV